MAERMISIGNVRIPLIDYAITGNAVLGIRGAGKTYLAKGIAEQMLDFKVPIVVFDPIGQWRYLRRGCAKGVKGFKIVVAGGQEPDLPLNPHNVPELIRAAIRENIPLVIDLYDRRLSKGDWRRIVRDSFRTLLYENEGVRHIFLEETAEFAPQKVFDQETYAEVEKLVRMGGNASLGITLINQRSQEVNKAVLDLCENLVLMRQRGAHAIDALSKWLDKISPDDAKAITTEMPTMEQGAAWVFKGSEPAPRKTQSKPLRSFHPDRRKPELVSRAGKVTDISEFVDRMAKELKDEDKPLNIEEMKRELKTLRHANQVMRDAKPTMAHVGLNPKLASQLKVLAGYNKKLELENKSLGAHLISMRMAYNKMIDTLTPQMSEIIVALKANKIRAAKTLPKSKLSERVHVPQFDRVVATVPVMHKYPEHSVPRASEKIGSTNGDGTYVERNRATGDYKDIKKGERTVLTVIAQHMHLGGVTESQIAVITGYKETSRYTFLKHLKAAGLVRLTSGSWFAQPAGLELLGPDFEPLPTGPALRSHWLEKLTGGEREVFELLVKAYPQNYSEADLMQHTGYKQTSVYTFTKHLKARQLIEGPSGAMKAVDHLFAE